MIFFSDIITNNISSANDFCWCVDQKKHRQYWQEQHCFLIRYFIWWETLYYKWHYWAKELRIAACLMRAECYCILVEQSPNVNPFRTAVHLVVNQHHFDPHITLKACSFAKLNSDTKLRYSKKNFLGCLKNLKRFQTQTQIDFFCLFYVMFRVIFLQNPNTKHIRKIFVSPNPLQTPKGYPIEHTWGLGTLYWVPPSTLSLA